MREWIRGEWHTMCPAIAAFVILPKNEGRQTICCQVVCGSRVSSTLLTSCPRLFEHDLPLAFEILGNPSTQIKLNRIVSKK